MSYRKSKAANITRDAMYAVTKARMGARLRCFSIALRFTPPAVRLVHDSHRKQRASLARCFYAVQRQDTSRLVPNVSRFCYAFNLLTERGTHEPRRTTATAAIAFIRHDLLAEELDKLIIHYLRPIRCEHMSSIRDHTHLDGRGH